MPENYKVESDVPAPIKGTYKLILGLKVGESFTFPREKRDVVASFVTRVKKNSDKQYTLSNEDETTSRIWRIK